MIKTLALAAGLLAASPLFAADPPTVGDPFPELGGDDLLWMAGKRPDILVLDPRARTLVVYTSVW